MTESHIDVQVLMDYLLKLLPGQFSEVVVRSGAPRTSLHGSQSDQVTQLIQWAQDNKELHHVLGALVKTAPDFEEPIRRETRKWREESAQLEEAPVSARDAWIDEVPFDWTHRQSSALRKLLASAYPMSRGAYNLGKSAGLLVSHINWNLSASDLWYEIISEASRQGKLRDLLDGVLKDNSVEGHHQPLKAILGQSSPLDQIQEATATEEDTGGDAWWRFEALGEQTRWVEIKIGIQASWEAHSPDDDTHFSLTDSDGTDRSGTFTNRWSPEALATLRKSLTYAEAGTSSERLAHLAFGRQLRLALGENDALTTSLNLLARDGEEALLIIRPMSFFHQLLPWELLCVDIDVGGRHLVLRPRKSLVRKFPTYASARSRPQMDDSGGTFLFAWSHGERDQGVPASTHEETLSALCEKKNIPFEVLPNLQDMGTLVDKVEALADAGAPVRVLHLLCHGKANKNGWNLAFEREVISPDRFRTLLEHKLTRLALLSLHSCHGADAAMDDEITANPLGSVAQGAFYAGVPVVASQFPLSSAGSGTAVKTFFGRLLLDTDSLSKALQHTIADLSLRHSNRHDWASLVLMIPDT